MDRPEDRNAELRPLGLTLADAKVIGRKLAEARERKKISVADLSKRVRIREHFVLAIEQGDWGSLPPGLNGRGLVRICARELGVGIPELDPSAHLTATNARFERAEQASAEQNLRAQTIKTYPSNQPPQSHGKNSAALRPGAARRPVVGDRNPPADRGKGTASPAAASSHADVRRTPPPSQDTPEDEAPLDVLTPDIASVLGIDLSEPDQRSSDQRKSTASDSGASGPDGFADIPAVDVGDVLGFGIANGSESASDRDAHQEPAPVAANSNWGDESTNTTPGVVTAPQPFGSDPEPSALHSYVEQIARTRPEPQQRGEAHADKSFVQQSAYSQMEDGKGLGSRQRRSNALRGLLVLGATAVAFVAIGFFYLMPMTQQNPTPGIEDIGAFEDEESPSATDQRATEQADLEQTGLEQSAGVQDPVSEPVPEPVPVPALEPAPVETEKAAQTEPLSVPAADVPPAEPLPLAAASEGAPVIQEAAEASPVPGAEVPALASIGTGSARALVTIKSPVGVQIRSNGQVLMQGAQESGSFELRFSGRAELIVDDGSKVELSYGDWAHGPLGHPGRKRRLVLNSEDF